MEVLVTYVKTKRVKISKEDEKFITMTDDFNYGKLSAEESEEYDEWVHDFVDRLYSEPMDEDIVEINNIESEEMANFIYDV